MLPNGYVSLGGLPFALPLSFLAPSAVLCRDRFCFVPFPLSPFRLHSQPSSLFPLPSSRSPQYSVSKISILPSLILLLESERKRTLDERSNASSTCHVAKLGSDMDGDISEDVRAVASEALRNPSLLLHSVTMHTSRVKHIIHKETDKIDIRADSELLRMKADM
ncbi:hypothetical protein FCM35_KLT00016 [Carex littledalei]|uniref:Uncharacterized protein n=1 Tax=Carex littledalei TaxID=544730 RepID=A0A833RVF9_9POAL|nr:hypothetical protein FCM35_KLT00016 [Carex littledalei]